MIVCSNCGEENPPKFRLCGFCGTPLVQAAPAHEFRKLVTILFCDLKGSTSLGEALDPESLREVMNKLVADDVDVEEVEPLTLKGKSQPVAAYRLIRVHAPDAPAPPAEHALVGRQRELAELLTLLDEVVEKAAPKSVLVLGEAG